MRPLGPTVVTPTSSSPERPPLVLVINDMIFETKIRSTAQAIGLNTIVVRSAGDIERTIAEHRPRVVLVDLNTAGDAVRAVELAKRHPSAPTVVAYGAHVDTALAEQAAAAGADPVLPRSRFSAELPRLLAAWCGP
jgi:DNA-binding NarL/FixJ family response regulator